MCQKQMVVCEYASVRVYKEYCWSEVVTHTTRESCWIVVDGFVLDVTEWLPKHPGGDLVILNWAGKDATDVVFAFHGSEVRNKYLNQYKIGLLVDYAPNQLVKDFRAFARKIDSSMIVSSVYYYKLLLWYFVLFSASLVLVIGFSRKFFASVLLGGSLMGLFFQQIAFLGHDLGHIAVTHDRRIDSLLGVLSGNLFSGISVGWWKATHNTHHVVTNSVKGDPDIQHLPFFAVSPELTESVYSTYHERSLLYDAVARVVVPWQGYSYYLVMAFARFNLYIQSFMFLFAQKVYRDRRVRTVWSLELVGLLVFITWFSLLVACLPHTLWRIAFVLISHAVAGILHVQITLSHFAMPVYKEDKWHSFLEHQLATSLDIDCNPIWDWFHGGLQFQVAHHLFPRAPRHQLRGIRTLVMEFAKKHGLTYKCLPFIAANQEMMRHLSSVGASLSGKKSSAALLDMLNLNG